MLRRLQDFGLLPREIAQLLNEIRRIGNAAVHANAGGYRSPLHALKLTWQIALWFHRTFANPSYKCGPFIPPTAPPDESAELKAELARLQQDLHTYEASHQEKANSSPTYKRNSAKPKTSKPSGNRSP